MWRRLVIEWEFSFNCFCINSNPRDDQMIWKTVSLSFCSIVFAFFWPKLWSSETMIWKTVSVRTLVPIISALIAVRDPICTWQDMAWHGGTPLVHNGPHWSAWQDTAGPTTRKSSSAVSALIGLSLKEEVISLGGNNNPLFTMYNVPNKYKVHVMSSEQGGRSWQAFRQAQKMPSILSSDTHLLIRDKKT